MKLRSPDQWGLPGPMGKVTQVKGTISADSHCNEWGRRGRRGESCPVHWPQDTLRTSGDRARPLMVRTPAAV